jgi:integrase
MSRIMQHQIKPAASEAKIEIKGWHTLRHSYTTMLRQNNGDPKAVQELLRHNSIKVTMDIHDKAMSDEKQMAQKSASLGHSQTRPHRNAYRVGNWGSCKYLILWAPPMGFEPVLPP